MSYPSPAPGFKRPTTRRWPAALVGVAIALLLVFAYGPHGTLTRSEVCKLGPSIGTYTILTPTDLANIPDGGYASITTYGWNYTMVSGGVTLGPLKPLGPFAVTTEHNVPFSGILSDWAVFNWTFYRTENTTVVGGAPDPCTQAFLAQINFYGVCGGLGIVIPISNNSTDASDPHTWSGDAQYNGTGPGCPTLTSGAYVWFNTSFDSSDSSWGGSVDFNLCNRAGWYPLEVDGQVRIPVRVVVPFEGANISSAGYLTWSAFGYSHDQSILYEVTMGWNWLLSPVGPSSQSIDLGTGHVPALGFERLACSS